MTNQFLRPGLWIDLALCIIVLPALLLIFPIEDWAGWDSAYVFWFVLWLYLNYFLHRRVSAPLMLSGSLWRWSSAGLIFISAAVTFLMSLHQVGEPGPAAAGAAGPAGTAGAAARLEAHQQALWVLYIVTTFTGVAVGILDEKLKMAEADKAILRRQELQQSELGLRADGAVAGESVTVKVGYQSVQVPVADIQYVESRGNYACIHRDHGDDVITQITLKALSDLLPSGQFLRVHRSFLVPAWRIQSHSTTAVRLLGVDREIPVGRAHKENLKA